MFRKVLFKIYQIGKFEYDKKLAFERSHFLKSISQFNPDLVNISPNSLIENKSGIPESIQIGNGCLIQGNIIVQKNGGSIKIGDDSFLGPFSNIWSVKGINIGKRVLIAHNVNIIDNNSHPLDSKERHKDFLSILKTGIQEASNLQGKEIVINDDVWIGFNATILKGVNIGQGAVIGACSLITEDVPPFSIVVGNPQRTIKYTT